MEKHMRGANPKTPLTNLGVLLTGQENATSTLEKEPSNGVGLVRFPRIPGAACWQDTDRWNTLECTFVF